MTRASRLSGGLQLLKFVALLTACLVHGRFTRPQTLAERGRWRQRWCRIILRGMRIDVNVAGVGAESGLLVCNHLSYLDALVLGALTPAIFVSKSEVRRWPMIGSMCARGGTIFMQRERARDTVRAKDAMQQAMELNLPVFVFPEGTTTDGLEPLPFHPALFAPAVDAKAPISPLALSYWYRDRSSATPPLAYFGDVRFVPHFLGFMRLRGVSALVQAVPHSIHADDRAVAARQSREVIAKLLADAPAVARARLADAMDSMPEAALAQSL